VTARLELALATCTFVGVREEKGFALRVPNFEMVSTYQGTVGAQPVNQGREVCIHEP
jgi:hypothetical protein